MTDDGDFKQDWSELAPPARRSLELAYLSLLSGGLACGAVLTDAAGAIVAEGRNRAYDEPGGREILQGTPLAHAELNVLAAVATDRDLSECTLWSTQEPCPMCAAAAAFTGVGFVNYLAPDPSDDQRPGGSVRGLAADDRWLVAANVLFMLSITRARGLEHSTLVENAEREPETTAVVYEIAGPHGIQHLPASADAFLPHWWMTACLAGEQRAARRQLAR
jgi:tRNA(Arg) A34 adenosine deaminase TadA